MIFKNLAGQGVYLTAYDKTTSAGKTGDSANITATISKDGAAAAPTATANPTEVGGGVYWLPLSQAEVNCNAFAVIPASATANIIVNTVIAYTTGGFAFANLDAAVSSRSTYSGGDTPGTTTLLGRLTVPRASNLDNIDVLVSSVAPGVWSAGSRTLTAFAFPVAISDKTGFSLTAAYDAAKAANSIAPDNATIAAIHERTQNLPDDPAATSDVSGGGGSTGPTAAEIADAVLGRNLAGGADGGRTVRDALRTFRNKVGMVTQGQNTVLTIYQEDDQTPAWTATVDSDASAKPITGVDPD